MLVILIIQWGYPFRNLQHAPKAEKVEYRMVLLVFGGWGRGGGDCGHHVDQSKFLSVLWGVV